MSEQAERTEPKQMLVVRHQLAEKAELDEDFLRLAVKVGATHVDVSGLPFRYNAFMPDNSDPYPNWSQHSLGLFRVCPPPALQPYLPMDVIADNVASLDSRFAMLRRHGLRAVVHALEPLWLPEAVFRAHPLWRGGQCELGRIANAAYFTPNIDEPEVLELYRQSAREFCTRYPEVDVLSFFTNDSGAGLQWSTYQYPGINGPTRSRGRGPGERVAGWMNAIRDGAAEAGTKLRINIGTFTFPAHETEAMRAKFGDHLYLKNINGNGSSLWQASASPGGGDQRLIVGLSNGSQYVEGLQKVFAEEEGERRNLVIGDKLSQTLLESYLESPGTGVVHVAETLRRAAVKLAGEAHAEQLVRAWASTDRAWHAMNQVRQRGGVGPLTGSTMGRWLVRPLVPRPDRLTDAETAPFKRFIFSKAEDKDMTDLCTVLGKPVFIGSCAVWMARWALQEAVTTLQATHRELTRLAAEATGGDPDWLALHAARVGAFACVLENARVTLLYQHALNTTEESRFGANVWDFDDNVQYDQRAIELRRLAREDLDNTTDLLNLLEANDGLVLMQTNTAEDESVFMYGPNLADQLRHKQQVMLDHWHEYEELYPTSRAHEYEPAPHREAPQPGL